MVMKRFRWALAAIVGIASALASCSGQRLLNTLTPPGGYSRASNVIFDDATGLKLDVYTPTNAKNAPVVIFYYGGRWTDGDVASYEFVGAALAKQGLVAVIPDYRHYPQVKFPTFVQDAAKAVRWTHDHAQAYGGDVGRIFVMGHSAGAHLAAMLATDESYLAEVGGSRSWLAGMIGLAGPYDFLPFKEADLKDMFGPPENYANSQPINHVDGRNPPLLLLHGDNDTSVWPKNTRNFAARVKAAGGPVEVVIYPKMTHSWIVATLSQPLQGQSDVMAYTVDFVLRKSGLKADNGPAPVSN